MAPIGLDFGQLSNAASEDESDKEDHTRISFGALSSVVSEEECDKSVDGLSGAKVDEKKDSMSMEAWYSLMKSMGNASSPVKFDLGELSDAVSDDQEEQHRVVQPLGCRTARAS